MYTLVIMRIALLAQLKEIYDKTTEPTIAEYKIQQSACRIKPRKWELIARKTRMSMVVSWYNMNKPDIPLTTLVHNLDDLDVKFDGINILDISLN